MATQVKFNPYFLGLQPLNDKDFFPITEFFCKEEPKKVLEVLAHDYFIANYKSIYLPTRTYVHNGSYVILYDLKIMDAQVPKGLEITKNISEFDVSFYKSAQTPDYFERKQKTLLADLINRMLITIHTDQFMPRDMPKVKNITNYLETRKEKQDDYKEAQINDILELSSVFLQKDITIKDLENTKLSLPKKGETYMHLPGLNC